MPKTEPRATILVIDDEEIVRDVIREPLEQRGYRVLLSSDGISGVHRFRQASSSIGLVIIDRSMPRMNGDEAAAQIKAVRDVPILIISGYMSTDLPSSLAEDPTVRFLKKPFRARELVAEVRSLLGEEPDQED